MHSPNLAVWDEPRADSWGHKLVVSGSTLLSIRNGEFCHY